ncbi:FAD-dependent oxidoreductase [Streptomyces sp. MBT65]|uniref:FAD-dependent oxidoreductase n=1 Tax=Streptomyces sp. MBT65 TaxID=1488395 RepID=UPI0035B192D4
MTKGRAGSPWGGPTARGRGGAARAAAAPGDPTGVSRGGATPGDRAHTSGDGTPLTERASTPTVAGPAPRTRGGVTGASWEALRDRAGAPWNRATLRDRADVSPGDRRDSSWGGPTLKDRPTDIRGAAIPRSRAGAPLGGPVDQARLGTALTRLAGTPVERLLARPESAAGQALAARGVPARTIDGFLRPLLAALLCDPELTTSSRCADLALRAFAGGRLCLPEGGAEMLPEVLAAALPPGTVHTGVRVTAVSTTSVTTAEHGEIRCRAVLVATDARAAAELLPGLRVPDFHQVTVVHHTTDDPPATGAALLLDSDRGGPVAHTAIVSEVDPSRAPAGRALVSSTVLGPPPPDVETAVRRHLARLYGTSTTRWETLAVHHTATAVPVMRPPHDLRRPVRLLAGLYVCGDHRDTSTVQGALHSGHRASAAILGDLSATGSLHRAERIRTTQAA